MPGCITKDAGIEAALEAGKDALGMCLYKKRLSGELFPKASDPRTLRCSLNGFISLIEIHAGDSIIRTDRLKSIDSSDLPIDMELVKKHAYLPVKLAQLSYVDSEGALRLLRQWGEGKKPVSSLWVEIIEALDPV